MLEILRAPIGDQKLIYLELGGAFAIRLKLGVLVGVALAFPVIVWQLWAFVAPGLTSHERRVARPWVPLMVVFFLLGVGVAYVILPAAASFLRSFEIPGVLESTLTAEAYFGFVTMLFLAFGAVMQFPIVIVVLNRIGLLSVERLRAQPALRAPGHRHLRRGRDPRRRPGQPARSCRRSCTACTS